MGPITHDTQGHEDTHWLWEQAEVDGERGGL